MLSVTGRIKTISQPIGGFVPKKLFYFEKYNDGKEIKQHSLYSIQGLAVDYLSRFMITGDKTTAFDISLNGARVVDSVSDSNDATKNAIQLLNNINGLDRDSIVSACKLVCYDVAFRAGMSNYISPDDVQLNDDLFNNVSILVKRVLKLFKCVGNITNSGFTFDGGYTELVSSGDGDYLTEDTIIELKTSTKEFSPEWSLQLLMYYILGIHSINSEFKAINRLCIVNPYLNQYCICNIADISDKVKWYVSHNIIGYRMVSYIYNNWKDVIGSDKYVVREFLTSQCAVTDFKIDNFGNGIFDITIDDYWTFLKNNTYHSLRPRFKYIQSVKFIKYNKYFMFVAVSKTGTHSILQGARLRKATQTLEYYYSNMEKYANSVLSGFKEYWNALDIISEQVKLLHGDGTIHGCIVDIDDYNHIYLNPYDGTVVPYYAISMDDKDVFDNVTSLLSVKRRDLLKYSKKLLIENTKSNNILAVYRSNPLALVSKDDVVNKKSIKVYSREMYTVSTRIKPLQDIRKTGLVQVWYDGIMNGDNMLIEDKIENLSKDKRNGCIEYLNKRFTEKNDKVVTVIAYRNYHDVDVMFEDGYIMYNVRMDRVKRGTLVHPDIKIQKAQKKPKDSNKRCNPKELYTGMKVLMRCGMYAICTEYKDSKHLTVKFEDGLIRTDIRSDHFKDGKVAHTEQ